MKEVGFAQTDPAINEKWIVVPPGLLGDALSSGITELIAISDDEVLKGIARV
jgi:hypothetical protein